MNHSTKVCLCSSLEWRFGLIMVGSILLCSHFILGEPYSLGFTQSNTNNRNINISHVYSWICIIGHPKAEFSHFLQSLQDSCHVVWQPPPTTQIPLSTWIPFPSFCLPITQNPICFLFKMIYLGKSLPPWQRSLSRCFSKQGSSLHNRNSDVS